jgi:predicted short-subunit dehydrogenase-like oxidoreductase (DUF2520 family)
MRELERHRQPSRARDLTTLERVAVVGSGRLGNALAAALRAAGVEVAGPLGRGHAPGEADAVLLCVPDAEIATAAETVPDGLAVGHCSGATGLGALGAREAFSLHPLMTVTAGTETTVFAGAGAAVAGSSPAMLALARALAQRLGMRSIEIAPGDRTAYHAAASIASNFLVTLEAAAERLAGTVGVDREDLLPLVRATVENWARLGSEHALTGPVARGDEVTVAAQRQAIAERAPDLLALFDTMVDATRALATAKALV